MVELHLAKVVVESSNLFARSILKPRLEHQLGLFHFRLSPKDGGKGEQRFPLRGEALLHSSLPRSGVATLHLSETKESVTRKWGMNLFHSPRYEITSVTFGALLLGGLRCCVPPARPLHFKVSAGTPVGAFWFMPEWHFRTYNYLPFRKQARRLRYNSYRRHLGGFGARWKRAIRLSYRR